MDTPLPPQEPAAASPRRELSGMRRAIASVLLAIGLMVVGGVAIVNAASPAPSNGAGGSSAPAASGSPGAPGPHTGNCPNM